jgi:hypothetical protein
MTDTTTRFLEKGADERLHVNEKGITKYGMYLVDKKVINRGSCTCNAASEDDIKMIHALQECNTNAVHWEKTLDENSQHIKQYFQQEGDNNFEIFYAPSGTDLLYYTFLIS